MNRDYVIVCMRHRAIAPGALLFWGAYTADKEKRSFGGYFSDFEKCEKYTLEEAVNGMSQSCKVWGDKRVNYRKTDDFIIRIDQLEEYGYRPMLLYIR